jgi:putative transposase
MEVILFLKFNIILYLSRNNVKVLKGDVGLKVRELIRQTCEAFEIAILKGVVSQDHVHILVSAPPNLAASEIMRRIKGRSSMKLFESFPDLKKRYWGRHFWARGYFCVISGELTDEMIKNHLEHHFEPKGDDDFRTET